MVPFSEFVPKQIGEIITTGPGDFCRSSVHFLGIYPNSGAGGGRSGAGVHVHEVTVSGLAVVGAFIHIAGTGMALGL